MTLTDQLVLYQLVGLHVFSVLPKEVFMPAYLVAQVEVKDSEAFAPYPELTLPIVAKHGGRPLAVSFDPHVEEGAWPGNTVILEFSDMSALRAFLDDPAYAEPKALRRRTTNSNIILLEGPPQI